MGRFAIAFGSRVVLTALLNGGVYLVFAIPEVQRLQLPAYHNLGFPKSSESLTRRTKRRSTISASDSFRGNRIFIGAASCSTSCARAPSALVVPEARPASRTAAGRNRINTRRTMNQARNFFVRPR